MKAIANKIVDALLSEGWWGDLKTTLGFGSDEYGLGKNTEPGWRPSYDTSVRAKTPEDEERIRKRREELLRRKKLDAWLKKHDKNHSGETTWKLD